MLLDGTVWYYMVLCGITWYCVVLHGTVWYCMALCNRFSRGMFVLTPHSRFLCNILVVLIRAVPGITRIFSVALSYVGCLCAYLLVSVFSHGHA